jgi:hypothetical protein
MSHIRKAPKISPAAAESRRDPISNALYHDLRIESIQLAIITGMVPEVLLTKPDLRGRVKERN